MLSLLTGIGSQHSLHYILQHVHGRHIDHQYWCPLYCSNTMEQAQEVHVGLSLLALCQKYNIGLSYRNFKGMTLKKAKGSQPMAKPLLTSMSQCEYQNNRPVQLKPNAYCCSSPFPSSYAATRTQAQSLWDCGLLNKQDMLVRAAWFPHLVRQDHYTLERDQNYQLGQNHLWLKLDLKLWLEVEPLCTSSSSCLAGIQATEDKI